MAQELRLFGVMATSTTQRDYYDVLGLARDADQQAIDQAYRQLACRFHPDVSRDPEAVEKFKRLSEAYAVLSDPEKRRRYDAHGFAGVSGYSHEDLFGDLDFGSLFGGLGGLDFGRGFFGRMFSRRRSGPRRGAHVEVPLEVPLERILTGGGETVRVMHPESCPACEGSGAKSGTQPVTCDVCGGSGQQVTSRQQKGVQFRQINACHACRGRGQIIHELCPDCQGRGIVEKEETLKVTIPPGVDDGCRLRIPGRGRPSPDAGGASGDLHVVIRTLADPRFERRGPHLWRMENIDSLDAVLGTTLQVPTLDGEVGMTIPAGTQPGTVLRLQGQGLPHRGREQRGDLVLAINIRIPSHLEPEEQSLYEQLRTINNAARSLDYGKSDVSRAL